MRTILLAAFVLALVAADLTTQTTGNDILIEDGPAPYALFCAKDACAATLAALINKSSSAACAFYDLDHPDIIAALGDAMEEGKDIRIVLDDRSTDGVPRAASHYIRIDGDDGQMHNKFCVFDGRVVWTGSMNPTVSGDEKNDNNVIVIASDGIAARFLDEFEELWEGEYRRGKRTRQARVRAANSSTEVLFCPEDHCADAVTDALVHANRTIHFIAFSFTHRGIADALVDAHDRGVDVRGVLERSGSSGASAVSLLRNAGIGVRPDANPAMMHHKVFIIDKRIVITGSFNPTYNGDARNDENLLIVEDTLLAARFEDEFRRIWKEAGY